jgi:3-hydroxyacyl-CoA dehydrogenase
LSIQHVGVVGAGTGGTGIRVSLERAQEHVLRPRHRAGFARFHYAEAI